MHNSVEELTKKIYQEGIEKAEQKAQEIINEAHQKAQEIVAKAEQKSTTMIADAEKRAADLKIKNETEMRLAARQAMSTLKQKIRDMLVWEVTSKPFPSAFDDKEFVQELIKKLVDFWLIHFGENENLNILLPKKDFEEAQGYVRNNVQELLKKGVRVDFDDTMTNGFQISPEDGRFKVSFTAEDFENYFKSFAKPRLFKLLFGDKQ